MLIELNRREFLMSSSIIAAGGPGTVPLGKRDPGGPAFPYRKALKYGMIQVGSSVQEKLQAALDAGFDGVEMDSPSSLTREDVQQATRATAMPIHGVVDSIHWHQRLSDPDPETRRSGIEGLETAIRDASNYGGSSVLLVPGRVADAAHENHDQVWTRSIEGIRHVLPLAAEKGIHVLIENVWNGFCYEHDGPDDQSADQLAAYIDEINSPWVGSYFDIGNHRKYGRPEEWIRTLGRRIVKLDVKDWGVSAGWSRIGDGDVDWPAVSRALADIGFCGWATAEVGGGGPGRLQDIAGRMDAVFAA